MNLKLLAACLCAGGILSASASAQTTIVVPAFGHFFERQEARTTFDDIAAAFRSPPTEGEDDSALRASLSAQVSALAAALNAASLYGAILIEGSIIALSAYDTLRGSANAAAGSLEATTTTARPYNANQLSTAVIGAMNTSDGLEGRIGDTLTTDFSTQDLSHDLVALNQLAMLDTSHSARLGHVELVSTAANAGNLAGHIAIVAPPSSPPWFLHEPATIAVTLSGVEIASMVIGAMNTSVAVAEVMRELELRTALQVVGRP